MVELLDLLHHLGLGGLDRRTNLVYVLKELGELWQSVEEGLNHDDTELLPPAISSKSLDNELKSNIL